MRSYLTGSFLITRMKVRYSPNHYLLLLLCLKLYVRRLVDAYLKKLTLYVSQCANICGYNLSAAKVGFYVTSVANVISSQHNYYNDYCGKERMELLTIVIDIFLA